jgi:mannosyl-3-phosphoglycerate phosphatase family protein
VSTGAATLLVFSDLDGSLLDHFSYSFEAALPALRALDRLEIPLVLASSKTCDEMLELRTALGNEHPFISENGAAVYIPRNYFPREPAATSPAGRFDEYRVHEMAPPRDRWLRELGALRGDFPDQFESFSDAGVGGIVEMTGLSESQALLASRRHYSEPVKWLGTPQGEARFIERLEDVGATVTRGGRFLSVSGDCDKGRALAWLRELYQEANPARIVHDLAAGDSDNDRAMLEAAGTALAVRSPVHDFPALGRDDGVIFSRATGPAGWAEGVMQWLRLHGIAI